VARAYEWLFAGLGGSDVVGLNCIRNPKTMLALLQEIVPAVAALPVPYSTRPEEPSFQSLRDPDYEHHPSGIPFSTALDPFICNRYEISDLAREAYDLGLSYFGVCCGAAPHHIRSMAEALGRTPRPVATPRICPNTHFGSDTSLKEQNVEYRSKPKPVLHGGPRARQTLM
jgi:betaine-homocysteine S-methyltransferase